MLGESLEGNSVQVNLVGIQAKMELGDYASFDAFRAKVSRLMLRAMEAADAAHPTLVVFPEYLGSYLSYVPFYWKEVEREAKATDAYARIVARNHGRIDQFSKQDPRAVAKRLLFVEHALETERAYTETFSALAREHGAYVFAGSLCVPEMDDNPHMGGRIIVDDTRVYNQSYLYGPSGLCAGRVAKVNLPPGEDQLLDGAPRSNLVACQTRIGRIGIGLCWDAIHHRTIETYEAQGADIVLNPCYFANPDIRFDGTGKHVPQPWDFIRLIQGRENIQFGVSSFLVGAVFEDQRAEGMCFIARNTGVAGTRWEDAIVAMTNDAYEEAIISALVDLEKIQTP